MQRRRPPERWRRADYNFAVASIAVLILFLAVGFGAWMFGGPSTAGVSPLPRASQIHTSP
jgi:hypothetical protein